MKRLLEVHAMIRLQQLMLAWVLMFVGVLGFSTTRAVEFAGGTGEPNDPYQIATAEQLLSIGKDKDLLKKHYVLLNTIDLSETPTVGLVISGPFRGTFDGKGYTIQNLGDEENKACALFEIISAGAEVRNVGIVNAHIDYIGALVGVNRGTVRNCYCTQTTVTASGTVGGLIGGNERGIVTDCHSEAEVSGPNNVGGLIGSSSGVLSRCHSSGKVVGDFNNVGGLIGSGGGEVSFCYSTSEVSGLNHVGGLIGYSNVVVSDSYSTGAVTGAGEDTGGLIGFNRSGISRCYSTSPVTGKTYVGGLVGTNTGHILGVQAGQISSCYVDANVVSDDLYSGGLVGYNWAGSIESCYSTGVVTGPDYVGGLVGYSDEESSISTSYTTVTVTASEDALYVGALAGEGTTESSYFLETGGPDNGIGTPLTDSEMKQQAYPILIWQAEIADPNDDAAISDEI
jgi:hypothetical protein